MEVSPPRRVILRLLPMYAAAACILTRMPFAAPVLPLRPIDLFGSNQVLDLSIVLDSNSFNSLAADPKKPVPATIRTAQGQISPASIHLKGLGSFQPITAKPSFSIRLREATSATRIFEQPRFLLENSSQDPTFLCRRLCSELFLSNGIPAARVNWASVRLNDRDLGLYTLSEAMNQDFLKRHFRSAAGNLYEGSNVDVGNDLEQDSGAQSRGRPEIQKLLAACREPDLAHRWETLQSRLDVDRFISYVALEVLITHHDGYSLDLNNYRLYSDPTTGQITFIPHGMDLVFDYPRLSLSPEWKGIVARAVMETPSGARLYRKQIQHLGDDIYGRETLLQRTAELSGFLHPTVAQQGRDAIVHFNGAVAILQERIRERARFIAGAAPAN